MSISERAPSESISRKDERPLPLFVGSLLERKLSCTNPKRNLLAMHRQVSRRVDADAHLAALNGEYGDGDVVGDHQCFANAPGENQHGNAQSRGRPYFSQT